MAIKKLRTYDDYEGYISHQAEKTSDTARRNRILDAFDGRKQLFISRLSHIKELVKGGRVLCLGARMGEEVSAFKELGYNAIGIDIVPYPPDVIEGDFNNIPFENETFDIVYSNCMDHALDENDFLKEAASKLKDNGYVIVDSRLDRPGAYEVLDLTESNMKDAIKASDFVRLVETKDTLTPLYEGVNMQFIMRKV